MLTARNLAAGLVLFLAATLLFVAVLRESPDDGDPGGNIQPDEAVTGTGQPGSDERGTPGGNADGPVKPGAGKGELIELADMASLRTGDRFAIFIPQEDISYEATVSETRQTAAGNRVISGFSRAESAPGDSTGGGSYRFLFTVGSKQTFGTLHTPLGRYQLEARDGVGRIIASRTIAESLDYSEPDFVIPVPEQPPAPEDERRPLPEADPE